MHWRGSAHRWQNWSGCRRHYAQLMSRPLFSYLGDMLCSGGGCCDSAARCRVTWGKFGKLLSVLTTRHLSPRMRHRVYGAWFARLCSIVVKRGDQINLDCSGLPQWPRHGLLDLWHNIQRVTYCIKYIMNFPIPRSRKYGWSRKTWSECVKTDVGHCGLAALDPQDRDALRAGVRHNLVLPTP